MNNKEINYKEAMRRLESIYEDLKEGSIDIDTLDKKLKEALELHRICKNRLKKQEMKISDFFKEVEEEIEG